MATLTLEKFNKKSTVVKPIADSVKAAVEIQRSKTATVEEKEEAAMVILDILIYYGYLEE